MHHIVRRVLRKGLLQGWAEGRRIPVVGMALTAASRGGGIRRLKAACFRIHSKVAVSFPLYPSRDSSAYILWAPPCSWDEHYSLRSLAIMLPGPLAWLVDWWGRRAVGVASERLLRFLTRVGTAPWSQQRHEK